MNYFEELLESYSQLKKRKLVIRIDERGEFQELQRQNPEKAQQIEVKLQQEFEGYSGGVVKSGEQIKAGSLNAVEVPEGQNAANMALPVENQAYVVNIQPKEVGGEVGAAVYFRAPGQTTNTMIISAAGNVNPKAFGQYKNALAQVEEGLPMLDGDVDTSLMNAGNLLGVENTSLVKQSLQNLVGLIRNAADQPDAADEGWARTEGVGVQGPASYITGNRQQSLERKLSRLQFVKINPATEGLEVAEVLPQVKANLLESALQSMENLYSFGSNFNSKAAKDKACTLLSNSIKRDVGGKIVALTGEDNSEGIRFTPSPADRWFMKRAEQICDTAIADAPRGKVDQHSINDYIGKTSESAGVALVALGVIHELMDGNEDALNKLSEYVRKTVIKDINLFRASFGKWISSVKTGSTDEEGAAVAYVADKLSDYIGIDSSEVMGFFSRLGRLQEPLTKALDPDIVVNVGKEKGQGFAADNNFIFMSSKGGKSAEERAKQAHANAGVKWNAKKNKATLRDLLKNADSKKLWMDIHSLSDDDLNQEVYFLGDGLKTKAVPYTESTLGESDRLDDVVDGIADTEVKEGYDATVRKRLGISEAEEQGVRDYNSELKDIKADIDTLFPQGGLEVFDPEKGNITSSDGKAQMGIIKDIITKSSTFEDIEHGPILRLFKDQKGRELDLSDPVNMAKVNEGLKRYLTALRVTQDSNDRNKKGELTAKAAQSRLWVMYAAQFVGGVDHEEASTVQDLPSMRTMTGPHMGTLNDATKGILNDTWDVEMPSPRGEHGHPGAALLLSNREDAADRLSFRQSRTWGAGGKANTRWSLVQPKYSFEKRAKINEVVGEASREDASILYQYINNQGKLLEQLVGLIKTT